MGKATATVATVTDVEVLVTPSGFGAYFVDVFVVGKFYETSLVQASNAEAAIPLGLVAAGLDPATPVAVVPV
jgi:hypothetical protein